VGRLELTLRPRLARLLVLAVVASATALAAPGVVSGQPEPPPPSPEPQPPPGFELTRSAVHPQKAFFGAKELPALTYEFAASTPVDVRVELVRAGKVVHSWRELAREPFTGHQLAWDPVKDQDPQRGRLSFRVGPEGGVTRPAGSFRLRDHFFPIRASHRYGDRFGVPRSGGRTHEGQDLWAACGSDLVAARGGTVQNKGYSGALYGHYVTIDAAGTERDFFYAHLAGPSPLGDGDQVFTGQRIGAVGKTGNASGEGCQLHFELWPHGYRDGRPADPLRDLKRWDRWS
jgi:murein DD-endopeptidase MepM/ murein hydrolase activator NlpD